MQISFTLLWNPEITQDKLSKFTIILSVTLTLAIVIHQNKGKIALLHAMKVV